MCLCVCVCVCVCVCFRVCVCVCVSVCVCVVCVCLCVCVVFVCVCVCVCVVCVCVCVCVAVISLCACAGVACLHVCVCGWGECAHTQLTNARVQQAGDDVNLVLIGNKCDAERDRVRGWLRWWRAHGMAWMGGWVGLGPTGGCGAQKVSKEEGRAMAAEYGAQFFETSAKENIGVDEVRAAAAAAHWSFGWTRHTYRCARAQAFTSIARCVKTRLDGGSRLSETPGVREGIVTLARTGGSAGAGGAAREGKTEREVPEKKKGCCT